MPVSSHAFFVSLATTIPVVRAWSARNQDDIVVATPPTVDGSKITAWEDTAGDLSFVQATTASQPAVEIDDMPGLTAVKLDGAQNMVVPIRGNFATGVIAMLVRFDALTSGQSRVILTRDTTASTTKPAWALTVSVA